MSYNITVDHELNPQVSEVAKGSFEVQLPAAWKQETLTGLLAGAFEHPDRITSHPRQSYEQRECSTRVHVSERHWLRITESLHPDEDPDITRLSFGYRGSQKVYVEIELPLPWLDNHPRQSSLKLAVRNRAAPGLVVSSHSLDQLEAACVLITHALYEFERA